VSALPSLRIVEPTDLISTNETNAAVLINEPTVSGL
jgi:hypothetical protein